jgi:hypothetical protein
MSASSPECVLFAGPSGCDTVLRLDGIDLRPPARRGDIAALAGSAPPGVVALADGVFHQALAVGHAEMRDAVAAGWQVWGLSSLGAIRACEMRHLGVRGYGVVYRRFVADESFSDDEVALLHAPGPPYQGVSEPLIHIRLGLQALVDARALAPARRRALLNRLKRMWYGDRTLGFVRAALLAAQPKSAPAIHAWLAGFQQYRAKSIDLQRFLEERPWRVPINSAEPRRDSDTRSRNRRIVTGSTTA